MPLYVHHTPGRLRVRLKQVKGSSARASSIEDTVRSLPGVKTTEANPLTGSVLIQFDPNRTSADQLLSEVNLLKGDGKPELWRTVSVRHPAPTDRSLAAHAVKSLAGFLLEIAMERAFITLLAVVF